MLFINSGTSHKLMAPANRTYAKGEELFLTYGDEKRSNWKWTMYGW